MSKRVTLFFEPLDVLQFRDHKPFDMGSHAVARTIFPQPPTFRGALRTLLFRHLGARFDDPDEHFGLAEEHAWARGWLGGRTRHGSLAIRGPLVARRTIAGAIEPLFHPPRDAKKVRPGETGTSLRFQLLRPQPLSALGTTTAPQRLRWRGDRCVEQTGDLPWLHFESEKPTEEHEENTYWTVAAAEDYFQLTRDADLREEELAPPLRGNNGPLLIRPENRVGIARNGATLTAEDHMFYVTSPFRAAPDVGFAIDVEVPAERGERPLHALRALDAAITTLGGKGHRARVRLLETQALVEDSLVISNTEVPRKIWLQTPLPLSGPLPGNTLVVAERPVPIGGFDLARAAPRSLRPALPAGSIIHLPAGAELPVSIDDSRTGYGFALAGASSASVPPAEVQPR
jgi:hypothetical protein